MLLLLEAVYAKTTSTPVMHVYKMNNFNQIYLLSRKKTAAFNYAISEGCNHYVQGVHEICFTGLLIKALHSAYFAKLQSILQMPLSNMLNMLLLI